VFYLKLIREKGKRRTDRTEEKKVNFRRIEKKEKSPKLVVIIFAPKEFCQIKGRKITKKVLKKE